MNWVRKETAVSIDEKLHCTSAFVYLRASKISNTKKVYAHQLYSICCCCYLLDPIPVYISLVASILPVSITNVYCIFELPLSVVVAIRNLGLSNYIYLFPLFPHFDCCISIQNNKKGCSCVYLRPHFVAVLSLSLSLKLYDIVPEQNSLYISFVANVTAGLM